jgi:parallel beta-helix repeat protein
LSIILFVLLIIPVGASLAGWRQNYGGTDNDYATSLVQTSDGGYAIGGYTTSFGAGMDDFWLIKADSSGNLEWNETYGGTSIDRASALVQTSDDGYAIAGETLSYGAGGGDYWLVKTDANGNMQWNKQYGGTDRDSAQSLVQTSDGGYAIGGYTHSFGAGSIDAWLVKTDASGNMEWNKTYGEADRDIASSLVQTSDGGFAIAGQTYSIGAGEGDFWLIKTDGSGNVQWSQTYGGTGTEGIFASLIQTSDGGYAVAGETSSFGAGSQDFWLVKTDSAGDLQWSQTYGGTVSDVAYSLIQTVDGGYAIAGESNSFAEGDFWWFKTDANGNMEWNQTYGGTESDLAVSLVQSSDGGYAITGPTRSFSSGGYDAWLLKTDEDGVVPDFRVYIRADGTVEGTDKIRRDGNSYTFTDNVFNEIIVEIDAITVDGNGYTLYGPRSGVGFDLAGVDNVTIQNVNIQGFRTGVLLQTSFYITISGNTITNNRNGIDLTYSYDNIISGNTITNNNYGIRFSGGSHNMILDNTIINNSNDGFQMYGSYNTVSQNTISDNSGNGFMLRDSSMYNVIRGNTITNNNNLGISLTRATFNIILENNITDNTNGMFFRLHSSNNTIYSNNFANNMQILIENDSTNDWDNGVVGNYWNGYNGTDSDGDGVGDTPYVIDENNQDNYPLVGQYVIPEFPSWTPLLIAGFFAVTVFSIAYRCGLRRGRKK